MAKLFAHLQEPAPNPSTINPALPTKLDTVLERGLAKNPATRYATATELVSDVAAALGTDPAPARSRPRRRTLILLAAAALAALGGLAAALALTLGGTSTPPKPILPLTGDSVVRIDAASDQVTAAVPVQDSGAIAAGLGSVWVIDQSKLELIQIDPETARRRAVRLDEPFPKATSPPSIAAGEGGIWLAFGAEHGNADGEWLWRVDAATGEIVKLDRAINAYHLVVGGGAVWVTKPLQHPRTGPRDLPRAVVVAKTIYFPAQRFPTAMAIGETGLWILLASSENVAPSTKNELWRIDPASGTTLARLELPFVPTDFAVDATSLWVVNPSADEVVQLDPETGDVRNTVRVGRIPDTIAVSGGTVWVANSRDGTVSRIDSETLDVTTVRVGGTARGHRCHPGRGLGERLSRLISTSRIGQGPGRDVPDQPGRRHPRLQALQPEHRFSGGHGLTQRART